MALRDRWSGRTLDVQVLHADHADIDFDVPCSVCGGTDSCSVDDPDGGPFGVEIAPFVHAEREHDWPCGVCQGADDDCPECGGSGVVHRPACEVAP